MATNVILPVLGMAQDTGKIVQWLHAEGDHVQQGEPIAEIETDKVTVELESPATGILTTLSAIAGADVPVGQVIAVILAVGEVPIASAPTPVAVASTMNDTAHSVPAPTINVPSEQGGTRLASPLAKRIAVERGVDVAAVFGTGPNGVVIAADVRAFTASARPTATAVATSLGQTAPLSSPVVPSTGISAAWRIMAEHTTQSWTTVPHFFLLRDVDVTAFKQWHASAQKRASDKLTYTDLLVKVVATALRQHPQVNASWSNGTIIPNPSVHIGIAVAVADGLLVPVIAAADDLSLNGIARHRKDLVERAQSGKLRPTDLQGGTFTISNLGMYGVDAFNAIINAPQAAILAVGAMTDRVVPVAGQPTVRPMFTLSLSCDHRVIDGARGAQFLATVAELIADPSGL